MRKKRREEAETAASYANGGNSASDDMPWSEVDASLGTVVTTQD